ncbi:2-dehydropantoate 2-reductase N-terminal domain-containing protein [Nocardia sp. NPDC004860]|uniref:ketopantoate reductase family protein n=1 Tax=Nocardia sp. NPDC004860 TaxID=3154557 RepID=UPI0033AECEB9
MTRYVIVGAGAVGVSLAVELADRGHHTLVVAHGNPLHHFATHPLVYRTAAGVRTIRLPVAAGTGNLGFEPGDILILAVKSQHVARAAQSLAWHDVRDPDGTPLGVAAEHIPVVTVQNGLDAERAAARWFDTVLGATLVLSVGYEHLGEIRSGIEPRTGAVFAGLANDTAGIGKAVLETFVEDLRHAHFRAEQVTDIRSYKATKLVYSVTNGLEVLGGSAADKARVGAALIAEARSVLTAAGIPVHPLTALVPDATPDATYRATDARQSTWQSFARGADTNEVDYLNGEIALIARENGLEAPANSALQRLLGRATRHGGGLDLPGLDTLAALLPADCGEPGAQRSD